MAKGTAEEGFETRFGLPGGAQVWVNTTGDNTYYVVFAVPDTEPPVYMRWTIPSFKDVQSFFGPDQTVVFDKKVASHTTAWKNTIDFGSSDDVANLTKAPFDSWASTLAVESESKPWILDADYQQLLAMSVIEGRNLTEGEIKTTKWWKTHNEAQREWMQLNAGDPAAAKQRIADNLTAVEVLMRDSGMEVNDDLVGFLANKLTQGDWSQTFLGDQMKRLADPFFNGEGLDKDLQKFVDTGEFDLGGMSDKENEVRDTVNRWLGTNFGKWSDKDVAHWAGRIRNEPDAMEVLTETLKDQKQALFGDYDREADYNAISAPWKNMMLNVWGESPDDSDVVLHDVIRMNNSGEAGQFLTREGLKRGNDNVVNRVQSAMTESFGGL